MDSNIYEKAYLPLPSELNPITLATQFLQRTVLEDGDRKVLSQGCELGTWEKIITEKILAEIIGIDINTVSLEFAKEVIDCLACSATDLSFKSNSFDVSYSPLVLQWLSHPDRFKNIKETARVLKKTGKALFIAPGPSHLKVELSYLPQFSNISTSDLEKKKTEFFISLRELKTYAKDTFSTISAHEVHQEISPKPDQRVALVYADTLAPNISHDIESYSKFLESLDKTTTTIHWVIIELQGG